MRILAIETSCDETAVCLAEASGDFPGRAGGPDFRFTVLGNALASQAALHAQYGGVYPNLAKREHQKNLVPVLEQALTESSKKQETRDKQDSRHQISKGEIQTILSREPELFEQLWPFLEKYGRPDIDAIAVTAGPGLEPALWVGVNFAKALSHAWGVPLVAVNHMEGHVLSAFLRKVGKEFSIINFQFPIIALLISGGHTEIVLSKEFGRYERIGQTRDDAAGEAFDKVARLLDLPYPGGPEIDRLAKEAREKDAPQHFKLPRPMINEDNFDFSFSGLKTAVRRIVEAHAPLSDEQKMSLAREFEDATADVLVEKTVRAVDAHGAQSVLVGGGVSANVHIKRELARRLSTVDCQLLTPPTGLSTDNALMIALAGYFRAAGDGYITADELRAVGNLKLQ